jgi:hypothetical protein
LHHSIHKCQQALSLKYPGRSNFLSAKPSKQVTSFKEFVIKARQWAMGHYSWKKLTVSDIWTVLLTYS